MSGDQNQNQQKQQGGAKAPSGIQLGATISPADIGNKHTIAGWFTILLASAGVLLCANKALPLIQRWCFGIRPSEKAPAPEVNPNTIVQMMKNKEGAFANGDSSLKWVMKEGWGALSDDGKANLKDFIVKQGGNNDGA